MATRAVGVKPISPEDAVKKKQEAIPAFVIQAFNEVIIANISDSGYANFKQDEVLRVVMSKGGVSSKEVFEKGWLDVEPIFRKAGWKVDYDKPGYNESYSANFTFRK